MAFDVVRAEHDGLESEKTPGRQRVTLQGHRQGKDELGDERPPGHTRPGQREQERVHDEEPDNGELVPIGRVAQEVCGEGLDHCFRHQFWTLFYFRAALNFSATSRRFFAQS